MHTDKGRLNRALTMFSVLDHGLGYLEDKNIKCSVLDKYWLSGRFKTYDAK